MKVLISPRSAARLAATATAALSLAPVTAAAATHTARPHAHTKAVRSDGLCDGHKWSLFGCRPDPRDG
jgi:hypothetical protein